MSFGNDFGRQTPIGAGIGGGLIQGLLGFLKQRQDAQQQAQQDKMDTLRQALLTQQISQGAQTFQSNQADAATERQRRATQDVQDQRAPMLGLLSHLISQGPQNPGVVANAYQQYQSTGQLPAQVPIYPNLPLPGASGGGPTAVNLPGSLSSIYSAAGAPQSERDFQARQQQARDLADQNLAFKREHDQSTADLAAKKAEAMQARQQQMILLRSGTEAQKTNARTWLNVFHTIFDPTADYERAKQAADDAVATGNFGGPAGAPGQPGAGAPVNPAVMAGTAAARLIQGLRNNLGQVGFHLPSPTTPGVALDPSAQASQVAAGLLNPAGQPQPAPIRTKTMSEVGKNDALAKAAADRTRIAQQRADDYSQATNALTDYRATMAGVAQGKLTLADAAQKHKIAMDSTGTFLQRAQAHLASVRATLALSQNSPQVQAAKAQLASLDKTRGILQKRYDDMANQIAAKSTQPLAAGQTAKGLATQLKVMQDLAGTLKGGLDAIDNQAAGALSTIRGGAPAAPPAASSKPAPAPPGGWAPGLSGLRKKAIAGFTSANGRAPTPAEASEMYLRVEKGWQPP